MSDSYATSRPFHPDIGCRVTYSQHLAGTYVCILADNDGRDKEFAHIKAKNLLGTRPYLWLD